MATKTASKSTKATNGRSTTARSTAARSTAKKSMTSEMENSKFHELFVEQLKDIYWAEKHLVKALGKMQKAATTAELVDCISEHVEVTKGQVERLEQIFELLGKKPQGKKCPAMEGLIEEGEEVIADTEADSMVRDAGIIIASQKIEHYEIASYGCLRTLAQKMGHDEIADLLQQTLDEEKEADTLLTSVAENNVNEEALSE